MEHITDLLAPEKENLNIREDPNTGVYVQNLSQGSNLCYALDYNLKFSILNPLWSCIHL